MRFRLLALLAILAALAAGLHTPRLLEVARERRLRALSADQLVALVRERPQDLAVRYQLGLAHARRGEYLPATRELLVVLEREPGRADLLNDLGVVYLLQQRYYESLVALTGALTARPGYPAALANLGRLHLATKMPYTATRELEQALRSGMDDPPTLCDLGLAYQQTLNFQAARRAYERVLRADPRHADAWLGLARTWEGLSDDARAVAAAGRALVLRPGDPSVLAALGRIELRRAVTPAEVRQASWRLAEAVRRDPDDPEARYDLARALRRQGDEAGAVTSLRRVLASVPDHAGAAYQLSQALAAIGQTAEGARVGAEFRRMAASAREQDRLEERVYQEPADLDARLRLARLYAAGRQPGLALLQCRQILDADPQHAAARRLAQSLAGQLAPREKVTR